MKDKRQFWELFFLILIILLAAFVRLWRLDSTPMIIDEVANLRDITAMLSWQSGFYPADFGWDYSQATLLYYPTILNARILNTIPNILTLRLTSILFSLLALIPFYFLVKEYANMIFALGITLLFAVNPFYLHFSRVGWTTIYVVSLGLYLIWFLRIFLKNGCYLWLILAGFMAGIILYGYRSGEVYIFAGFLYLIYISATTDHNPKRIFLNLSIFTAIFVLTSIPWLLQIGKNWELYNLRQRVVNVSSIQRPYHGLNQEGDILKYQTITSVKSWIFLGAVDGGGIENPRYLPLKDPPVNIVIRILFRPD
ncbi:glycosyltransferase family 39 protein [Candidatus Microgenomates bacterium]|nr:glycosyltransferase family 39 protein [Candidatus Microgenomates bacterium]